MAKLSLIVPCYNEADSLLSFCKNIFAVFEDISKTYSQSVFELIFVNDGSSDNTLQIRVNKCYTVALTCLQSSIYGTFFTKIA